MSKSQKEKLSDLLIGEAVMSLLDADEEVTFVALLRTLTHARNKPENRHKIAAYDVAIADVNAYTAPRSKGDDTAVRFAATDMSGSWSLGETPYGVNDRKH